MPDNRYYYFKDAKGNRHTVNKAAFDNDREGFAKAFPGARMEVIDRKTGRRGDVDVKDAGRVGDFGAHLFTGQTVRREKYQPKTSLGKAAQSVAQEKWGGKESALVKGLREADALKRRDEEQMPIDYTKPSAVKQMVGRTHREQQTLERRMEQAGREAGKDVMKPLREKEARLKTPVVDTGDANVNAHVINTQEQAERQLAESGLEFANKHLDDYVSDNILNEFKTATAKGAAAESALSKASPFAYMAAGKAYNEALDPDKLLKHLQEKANADIAKVLSQPKMQEKIGLKAAAYGISPEEYVEKSLIPGLQAKLAADFDKSELSRSMPKSTAEYILRGVNESMLGTIMSMGMTSKKQRQYAQRGMAMTDNGENPDVNPGMAARVARGTLGFVADAPVFGAAGKAGAAVAGKVFGNGVAQTARIANSTLGSRIARMAGSGMVSQGITGVLYGSTNAAVQNYSTGDDTSIGNTVKVMAMGGLSEGASWATMGGIGGAVGAGIYNVSGVKRIPAKVFQLAMEGIGMHIGGNVAKTIEGHDTDWTSIEGNLEACANVVALKLTHARLPKRQSKDGVKESYLDVVARNINGLMTSDGQRAAFGGYTFTNEEKEQLFGSASAPKRNESIYGYDAHNNPLTRKESLTSWAMRAKKTAAKGKGEESYKDTDAEFVKTAYDEIMADNTIPWDTKAKFSALVMGTVPSARPMMENCRIEGGSVNEYSKNGELLSKNSFKSIDERNSIIYSLNMKREDQRLSNAYGAAQIKDEKTAQATLEAVAEANGMTAEQLKAAMDKQPLRRSEEEQNACVALRKAYEDEQFVPGTLHAEQSNTEGKDVVEENNLGTENPNNEAVAKVLGDLTKAEDALQAAMDSNDVLKEEYERMQKAGMSNPQIYLELFNSGLTQEQLAPLADYINALSKAQGMFKGTQDKIVETTQKHVGQWSYKGELNGEKQNGEQMMFVKDNKGRVLIVGAGDVAFDSEGRVRDGDMLSVYDPATREMDFVHAKDVTLEHTTSSEEYAKDYQRQLEELNSTVYAEMQSGGEEGQPSLTEPAEPTKPKGEEGNEALLGLSEPTKPVGEKETTPVGEEPVATLADGTPVPMMKDSKGRETADYSQMTPEQGAEWIKTRFGENADGFVDGRIKRAEKAVKAAEKMKVDFSGEEEDVAEALASRKAAIESAEKELNYFTAVKNVMKQTKAAESAAGGEGATGNRYEQWRKDGYHIGEGGVRYDRQKKEDMTGVYGKDVKVDFTPTVGVNGRAKVVEVDSVQASHVNGQVNPMHFGPDWQPKDRTDIASKTGQDKALANFDPEKITGDGNAFIGSSPSVNERHEAIQGNNRVEILRRLYDEQPEKAAQYKQWLIDHAEEYGLDAAEIAKMKKPILVNELPVDDAKALELGQYRASDFESGGKELPRTSVVINRLGDKMQNVANIMLRQGILPEDAKMSDLVSQNATKVLDYLVKEGVVSATEEQTLRKDSTAMRQWMGELLKTGLFEGDKETEAAFNQLPDNARRAVLATYLRDAKSGDAAKIKQNLQRSFEAYSRMMNNPAFVNAKNVEEARAAVSAEIEKGNNSLFGEEPVRELFSNFELELAVLYKGLKDQKTLTGLLNKYFDAVQGDKVSNRQLEIGEEPREAISKEEALKEVFGLHESKPAETQRQVDKAIKIVATEITKKTGIEVVTDEKEAEEVLEKSENAIRENRSRWAGGEVVGMKQLPDKLHTDPDMLWNEISQYHGDYITRKLEKVPEDGTVKFFSAHDGKWYFYSVDKNHTITLFDAVEASRENYELFKDKLKKYGFDGNTKTVRDGMQEVGYTGRTDSDKYESFLAAGVQRGDRIRAGASERNEYDNRRGMAGETDGTQLEGNSEKQGEVKYFRTANGEVYGFTDGEKIYLDTKKMKPETPLHEYAHLWCDMLRKVNPKEWESVKKLFDEVDGLKDEVQKLYPELEGDALYEEMITTYSGREGTKKLEDVVRKLAAEEGKSVTESTKAQGFLEKVKEALTKYWKGVADVLGIHFTTAEEVADKVLADWAKGVDPRESEEGKGKSEESDTKVEGNEPSEASLGLTKPGEQPGEKSEGAKPVGDGKEPKANPLDGMRKAAELFKDEQITKARAELAEAKKSGDASEVKRLTDKLKGLMDSTLRGKGIGLVERRKIIGEELGKAEAEKIDKPWADMEFDEQVAETEKKPLDADEIKNSDCDGVDKANAVAYLNGDKNIINTLSYLTVYDNVRNRERDSVPSSGTEDGTQLDAADNAGGEGLGRTDSRPQGVDSGQLDRTEGDGNPERGESVQSGERVSGGESGEVHATAAVGEQGGEQVHGGASRVEPVSTGGTKPRGSRGVRGTGRDVRERGNEESGNFSDEKAGEATGGRGIDSRNLSTVEQIDKEISDTQSLVDDLFNSLFDGRTKGSIISDRTNASIIPLASDHLLGKLGINKQKMAVYKQLIPALTKLGYLHIKKGVVKLNDWIDAMKGSFGGHLTKLGLSDEEVYDYIKNMWNSNIEVDGVTHKLSEWASILGTERMKKEIATPNAEKYKRQVAAEPIKVKVGDMKNIEETLPFLLPQQHEDVLRAETQFFGNEHADREHAYGKGYMFTNGTGTGKTFTGLGVAKRLVKQGKGRILIVTPSQKKVSDWIKDGRNLNMEIRDLDSIAKERGTTATTESGEGVVITTFANFGVNKKLLETKWDAVIYDESHRIMENKNGTETARSMQHYMVTNRSENHCFLRLQETNKDYQKMKSLGERFDAERGKEVKRIQDEYKASHPSATPRDVAYATSRMLPKERNGFTPGDYASFPKLGKIHGEFVKALSHYTNEVEPKLKAQAKNEWKDTKTIFLSATPFNTRENLDYAEGYIFKYPEVEKGGRISGRTQFYLDHFGAAYKFRYNRLEQSTSNPEAVAKQEIEFSDYLQHTLGTMSGRIIDSPYDYSRDFPTVSPDHAEEFNQAVQDAVRGHGVLADAYRRTIGDYNYGSALFETMKVANIIERIKAHLNAGRKVVIFHRRVETKEPLKPPFASMLEQANRSIALMKPGEEQKKAIQAVKDFRKKYADLLEWEQTLDYSMPREQIAKVFGKDKVLFFSGKESTKVKDKAVDTFNSDDSGKNIIVIQEASGKEGISLHDTTGKHQRVCITLALPQSPITALQIEGRTYRIGNKSNAIFEYPILGLNSEMMLFGQKFNNQVSTTENLALGSQARSLRDSFANGILEHSGVVPIDQQGVGGKEFDAPKDQSTDGFDNAVLDYYSNQKLNSRNREGVDYFPTPEPLGYKMMEWANMGEGDTVLEPSAGHGAIARYAPKGNQMVAIEPSQSLFTKLQLKAGGLGRKFQNTIFENYDISNKHDVVVMNPPFGTAGATAIAHLGKAFKHLEEGGRVVALIPRGSTDKKFEKWIEGEKTAVMRAEVELPDIVFKQAGTNVVCRVVVVDKISNEAMRAKAGSVEKWNLGGHYDKIEDFFEDLRDVEMPDRIIDTNAIMMKKSKQTVKDLKELKDARVDFNEGGINVRVRGDWKDYSIPFDMEGYNAEQKKKFLASTYETFEQQERQTRNETSQAVLAELKKLTCKLADMTEEEMQRYLKKKYEGKGVMYRIEHAAEVYNKAKQHYRMELGNTFSDSKEHFDAVRDRAVEEKGIVMPNLNKEKVKVVEVEKHGFGENKADAIKNARIWAKDNLATKNGDMPTMRDGTPYIISKAAIDKYLSNSAISKSEDPFVHLSVLPKLTDVIHESIEAEIHPDYKKGEDGLRSVENGYGEGVLVHRLYGAVEIDGKTYRVKTTMQEFRGGEENKPHSYEVTKIELLDSPGKRENPDRPPLVSSNNSIDTAKLLQGVEKSYDSGKKLLDESKNLTDGETFFRKESDKSGYASLGLSKPTEPLVDGDAAPSVSERIGKAIDKAVEKTGGKVKMVNSVEEIGNEEVRRDIENGKQVTGWYDENTGEVHLYMPNIHDSYTAEKTVWHETVGHKGMRGLLGDKFNDYMRGLWLDLDNPVNAELRAYVKERMGKDSMGFYDAIEEFIAESAEKGKGEPGFWNYIKNKVTDALHEIGYRISPNVKDVKYMLWLAKNVQKKGNDPWWKMRADAVKWKIEHENVEYTKIHGGEFYENDGKNHDFEDMSREEWDEATDGQIHYRTAPSAATALDRYHKMLDAHGYMATEAFMDNMLSLDKLMRAVDPSIKKIEDVKSSMNPYILQNTMQGAMSDKMTLFEHQVMKPLDKAMSDVLDSFAGKNTEEKIRECNLYMIGKHGLERNRVLFVRDKIREERRVKSEESNSIDALEASWKGERNILGKKLRSGQIDLREYYRQMDEWIVQNIDKDFKAEEHDYSGMHGLQEIDDLKSPYDDAGAIDSVMSQEAKMESLKKGSVDNLWKRIKDATDYSIDSDYVNGLMDEIRQDRVKNMFDWYVPLRKYDEATAEDVYGYISGEDGKGFIGETLMNAKGRKSLSDVNVLAQIGAMGNRAIRNGGQNAVKQAFARFVRNSGEQNLVKETKVWVKKKGTDTNGNDIWEEAYPQIPENASADDIAAIVDAFETDMKVKRARGEAKTLSNSTDIGFKFARAKNKSEHFVDVKIAGRTHRFVVLGNPRAAQALNGMLENSSPNSALLKGLKSTTRFMAQMATSYSPEFVMRNIIRDAEFASSNVTAKEGVMYGKKWLRYYLELNPLNVAYNEGAGALKSLKWKDLKNGVGMGLYARYREGTLGNSKMERYFKEFMQNGGETGWVQVKTMQEWEKDYKRDVSREHSKVAKTGKALRDFLVGNVENLNEVAENMARFATFCTSRDLGRSAVRSAYDAKQVSTNFNRHGSGDAIKTFKNGEMGTSKEMRRNVYGTIASYLKNYSMFFNAGVQSTHLLMNNVKKAPVGTVASMMAMPFGLGILAALANNAMIANEDEKERKGVKDPYGELPEYIRRTNLCIYKGGGEFVTIPLAIELRAFYGLGDIAAGMTAAKNVKSTRNAAMDAVGCMSQLLPVVDFMNSATFDKEPGKELLKGVLPTAAAPFVEWWLNSDWKGTPIRREGDYTKNRPAWMNAYSGTPEKLMDLNKWVNAKTNDVAPGNENMRGNSLLDEATDPAMLNHIIGTLGGGAATFITRGTGLVLKYADGREQEIETKDIPFLRSLMYTPSEQTSMARTKAKWYGYKESMEKGTSNYSMLKNKNVPLTERIRNAADRHRFEQSADYARIRIIKDAEKQMKRWNKMKRLNADDKKQVDFANKNIEMIMQKAVEQMDKVSDD